MQTNMFHYPEDRAELFEGPSEEEAHFYFVLNDFEELIQKYGVDYVMTKIRFPTYLKLFDYFDDQG